MYDIERFLHIFVIRKTPLTLQDESLAINKYQTVKQKGKIDRSGGKKLKKKTDFRNTFVKVKDVENKLSGR